jgi:hypothetical protein
VLEDASDEDLKELMEEGLLPDGPGGEVGEGEFAGFSEWSEDGAESSEG